MDVYLRISLTSRPGGWQRGDVQEIQPAEHVWTPRERASDKWRLVRVPDLGEALAAQLTGRQHPPEPWPENDERRLALALRAYTLDLDALPDTGDLTAAQIAAAMRETPAPLDPQSLEGLRAAGWQDA